MEERLNFVVISRRAMGALARGESDQKENLFHARCKILDKVCSLIIYGGSCTNAVSQFLVESMKFPTRKHTSPYKLQWLNECGEIRVTKQAIIKFSIGRDAQHNGRSNKYSFVFEGRKYTLAPLTHYQVSEDCRIMKELQERVKKEEIEKRDKGSLVAIGGEGSSQDGSKRCMLAKPINCLKGIDERHFMEYDELFLEEITNGLPPLRGIEHQIDFVLGSQIPNKSAYRTNPEETKELQRQVEEILETGLVKKCLSPCAVLVILVPNKDGT
ncbi:uncharacterized protein LOC132613407 [Lycium barbarum]|uniref:uncharacterized protein LOC132613407 n=1 Tax=Lycium barbarum TaxID=112863 RepID=UPI00293F79BF|nr:uncharacterized protein LOC132613407 [Lycium barbarum]